MLVCFKVLGRGEKWRGGDYMSAPGGGQKVRLLKAALDDMKDEDKIIMFIDRWSFRVHCTYQCQTLVLKGDKVVHLTVYL